MLSDPSFKRSMAAVVGVGWVLTVSVILGTVLGNALDRKLNASPWFLIIGAALGTTVGLAHIWRIAKQSK